MHSDERSYYYCFKLQVLLLESEFVKLGKSSDDTQLIVTAKVLHANNDCDLVRRNVRVDQIARLFVDALDSGDCRVVSIGSMAWETIRKFNEKRHVLRIFFGLLPECRSAHTWVNNLAWVK